jgi:aspartyl-tRNA(Asn)/glutamyl-tRNA(Gln) amidotransferase subunit C
MAKLTKKDVIHVAELSNLNLSEKEIDKFLPQLSKIVEFVDVLSEVDTKDIKPTSQTTGLVNVLREDAIKSDQMLSQDASISGTDSSHNNLFKVPAILSERSA